MVECHLITLANQSVELIVRFLEAAETTRFSGEAPRNSCSWFVDINIIFPRCNPYLHRTRETPPTKPCGPLLLALTLPRLASKLSQRVVPWSLRWVMWIIVVPALVVTDMWQYSKLPPTGLPLVAISFTESERRLLDRPRLFPLHCGTS